MRKFLVYRQEISGARRTETVYAWDFNIIGDRSLVFSNQKRIAAFNDWIKVEEIK
jgi:hypothetical protein